VAGRCCAASTARGAAADPVPLWRATGRLVSSATACMTRRPMKG